MECRYFARKNRLSIPSPSPSIGRNELSRERHQTHSCIFYLTPAGLWVGLFGQLLSKSMKKAGGLCEQHPHAGPSTQRAQHRQRRRPPCTSTALTAGRARSGARRRGLQAAPEEVREPQSTPVAAAQPHAEELGPSLSCGGQERRGRPSQRLKRRVWLSGASFLSPGDSSD
jgi:hypothetical protein